MENNQNSSSKNVSKNVTTKNAQDATRNPQVTSKNVTSNATTSNDFRNSTKNK